MSRIRVDTQPSIIVRPRLARAAAPAEVEGVANALRSCNYLEGRSSKAELIEQLCDLADDALGQVGPVVRAQARIDGSR